MISHLFRRLRAWIFSRRLSRDVDDEMAFHLAMETEKEIAGGVAPSEADTRARRAFGSTVRAREESRDAHGLRWWDELVGDLRQVVRGTRRDPGFTVILVGTLTLGVFLATTIMATVDAILLRPVPYVDTERVVDLWARGNEGRVRSAITVDDWNFWSHQEALFDGIAAFDQRGVEYSGADDATVLAAAAVSEGFFRVIPVPAFIGRVLQPDDFTPGAPPVVVVSHHFWQSRLGGERGTVGKPLTLDGQSVTVVGVLPPDFKYPRSVIEVWKPMPWEESDLFLVWVKARLRTDPDATQRAIDAIADGGVESGPKPAHLEVRPFGGFRPSAEIRQGLYLMVGGAAAILLISGLNIMNLLIFRGVHRRREYATRLALGAGRARLIRQVVVEMCLVGITAAVVALVVGQGGIGALARLLPHDFTSMAFHDVALSRRVFLGTLTGSVMLALGVGLVPAIGASKTDAAVFRAGSLGAGLRSEGRVWFRSGLVVLQLAFSTLLVVGGGLFSLSFIALNRVDLGMQIDHLAVVDLQLSRTRYPDAQARNGFTTRLEERMRQIPGVEEIAFTDGVAPHTGMRFGARVLTSDSDGNDEGRDPGFIAQVTVDTNYFRVVGTPLLRGRDFEPSDPVNPQHPIVIDAEFADWIWPGRDPIGRQVRFAAKEEWSTVVGVVADTKATGPDDRQFRYVIFSPATSSTLGAVRSMAIKTRGDPAFVIAPIHRAIRELDPLQPIWRIQTGEDRFAEVMAKPRFLTWLMSGFAGAGLVLALVGLYGVLSFSVSQRVREIGVRMALGADSRRIVHWVLGQSGRLVVIGTGLGLLVAFRVASVAKPLLFNTPVHNPVVFLGVPLLLGMIGVGAALAPALRASRVDPVEVFRSD